MTVPQIALKQLEANYVDPSLQLWRTCNYFFLIIQIIIVTRVKKL
ncbi:hypothetical protein [Providencia hangzhouensis]